MVFAHFSFTGLKVVSCFLYIFIVKNYIITTKGYFLCI